MQHQKIESSKHVPFAPLGYVPHLVRNQSTNRLKVIFRVGTSQLHRKRVTDPVYRCVATYAVTPVGQSENVTVILCDVKLILDLTHDLLQYVFNRHQPSNPTEFVDNYCQMVAISTKLPQQVVQPF